jgi:hypothetical protein
VIADLATFIASGQARRITGPCIRVNGGTV